MTSPRRLEQDLPALLVDLYLAGTPNYRDDLVRQTARVRQRPAWTLPERWLPMELVTTRVPATRMPWRQIGVLALIAALLAAALAAYVGSTSQRLPAPFGPAANGIVAYSEVGDIYVADPTNGNATALITGPDTDLRPIFSQDGTKVAFERKVSGGDGLGLGHVYVARADGSGLTRVTTDPIVLTPSDVGEPYQFSPDGRSLVIPASLGGEASGILIAATAGSDVSRLDLETVADRVTTMTEAAFRPPDGKEMLFVGTDQNSANGGPGVYAVDLSTGAVRTIVEADSSHELDLARWSPDGRSISYATWDSTANGLTVRTHIVAADGTGDRVLPAPAGAVWDVGGSWSNDGTRLLIVRGYTADWQDSRAVIIPADGSVTGVEVVYPGPIQGNCCYAWKWSPDDSMVVGNPIDSSGQPQAQVVVDSATAELRPAPWTSTAQSTWQRVAP
jgi:dipeptidyl aminopeptidase/acylaminoacyl peptidase